MLLCCGIIGYTQLISSMPMSNTDKPLFNQKAHALEKEYEVCPECGGELSIKNGKAGPFLGCSQYPSCQYTRPVVEHERVDDQILPGSECVKCGSLLAVKQGRYGMFIGCSNYPACDHIEHEEEDESEEHVACPSCSKGQLHEKLSRFGKKFYSCDAYPKCKFIVNHKPVAGECVHCGFGLLVERHMAAGDKLQCASKKCGKYQ